MPKYSEGPLALFGLAALAIWTLVALPFIYSQEASNPLLALWRWATHDAVAAFTGVLALSTIGLWIVTGQGIRAQARDTRILQRAYVSVTPLGIKPMFSGGKPDNIVGHVECRNVGHLPARDLQVSYIMLKWVIDALDEDVLPVPLLPYKQVLTVQAAMTIGSIGVSTVDLRMVDIRAGHLLVWGEVRYLDGFDEPRFVKFCHRYPCALTKGSLASGLSIDAEHGRYHHYGNDAN